MDHNDTMVICICRDGKYADTLREFGFGHITMPRGGDSMRQLMGRALDEGYAYIITVNEDDGFSPGDVGKVADALRGGESALYIGARVNHAKKSLAANIYGFLSGLDANDVQTTLFGMSAELCRTMTGMKGKDENFLVNIPLEARSNDIPVKEIMTDAVCDTQPGLGLLTRSFKLYFVFIKFSIAAFIAYIVDIGTFYLFEHVFAFMASEYKILTATVLSRILCSIATYILNKGAVFKSHAHGSGVVIRFIVLSAAQLLASWLLVWGVGSLLGGSDLVNTGVKVVADLVIFIASFSIQRDWVFKERKSAP